MLYLTWAGRRPGDGEEYPIPDRAALVAAVEEEAGKIAADAGSDLLESPSQKDRDLLAKTVRQLMLAHLWRAGDSVRTPDGARWALVEKH